MSDVRSVGEGRRGLQIGCGEIGSAAGAPIAAIVAGICARPVTAGLIGVAGER
jgi:hypothetical protein